MLIGTQTHQFEFNATPLRLPANLKLGYTHGICVDTDDNLYVFNQAQQAVLVFDPFGEYQRGWGEEFAHGAHGMRLTNEDYAQFLYLTDYEHHRVFKTTLRGGEVYRLSVPPRHDLYDGPGDYKPTDACVAPDGRLFVFDGYGKSLVHLYDRKGKYVSSFGGAGAKPGSLDCPHGGWVDTRRATPELYVADRGHGRIAVFDLDGQFKREVRHAQLERPCGMYQYSDELYVPDLNGRLVVLDRNDAVAAVLGDNPGISKQPGWPNLGADKLVTGKFNSPHACCVNSRGDVWVAEWVNTGRVVKLVRKSPEPSRVRTEPAAVAT